VYGSQLVLPGQFINTAESPSPSFLRELQTTMSGRPPPPGRHNAAPAPSTLPEELLLARFVLVRRDGAEPPLSPIYDGPYRVLERSTHFFLLEMGDRTDKVSTLRLKPARTPADTEPAKPPRRGRPVAQAPPVRAPPPKQRGRPRQVTFSLPPTAPPTTRVVDPYSFFTDPDPDPELDVGGQYEYGSKSGSGSNTDPGL
jgi:hypothetical protein